MANTCAMQPRGASRKRAVLVLMKGNRPTIGICKASVESTYLQLISTEYRDVKPQAVQEDPLSVAASTWQAIFPFMLMSKHSLAVVISSHAYLQCAPDPSLLNSLPGSSIFY